MEFVVNIESGHELQEEITVTQNHLSHVRITSDDATVPLSSGFTNTNSAVIYIADSATGPVLDCLIDSGGIGGVGIKVINDSRMLVQSGAGVKNAGQTGLLVRYSSTAVAIASVFDGAGDRGVHRYNASRATVTNASIQNAAGHGIRSVRGSVVEAASANVSGAGDSGCNADRGG